MAEGNLAEAYRHAALAFQSAEYFPDDKDGAPLAESARVQLRTLKKNGVSAEEIRRKGNVHGKAIVEIP